MVPWFVSISSLYRVCTAPRPTKDKCKYWVGMPVAWYLKAVSSISWNSIVSLCKFIVFGGVLAFVSSLSQFSCVGTTVHLYLKLTAYVNNGSCLTPTTWFHGDHHSCQEEQATTKMAPTIGDVCKGHPKDSDDVVTKERPKLFNKQGEQNLDANPLSRLVSRVEYICNIYHVHCLSKC
jgi:hypothetical protein